MSENDKLLPHSTAIQFDSYPHAYYDDGESSGADGTDVDTGADQSLMVYYDDSKNHSHNTRLKRARRKRRVGAVSNRSKLDSLKGGLPLLPVRDDVSSDDEEEEESESARYRVSGYCTCDTYLLNTCYKRLAELTQLPSRPNAEYMAYSYQREHERATSHRNSDTVVNTVLRDLLSGCKVTLNYFGSDVLHMRLKDSQGIQKHIFVFEYGSLAFFNLSLAEEHGFIALLSRAEEEPLCNRERECGTEDLVYIEGDGAGTFSVQNDTIVLSSSSSLEKLSVAFAIAQAVKLNVFEEDVAIIIETNKSLPEGLAQHGRLDLSRTDMSKKIGQLFIERNNVNLHADVLDDPEFFWEQDKHKPVYDKLCKYLELSKRVGLLNKRLDIMKELFDMISDQLDNSRSAKLEYIIIYLILIEVAITVGWQIIVKDVLGFFQY
jgi:uncharacterized Rmd1/YagE family protein